MGCLVGVCDGRLNVVEPLPAPYSVPIAANSLAYVVRLTADPSRTIQPVGAVDLAV